MASVAMIQTALSLFLPSILSSLSIYVTLFFFFVTGALLMRRACEWHAGVLHNDTSDCVTVHRAVILHTLMILNVTRQHRPVS